MKQLLMQQLRQKSGKDAPVYIKVTVRWHRDTISTASNHQQARDGRPDKQHHPDKTAAAHFTTALQPDSASNLASPGWHWVQSEWQTL
jgi:hypothetical protein